MKIVFWISLLIILYVYLIYPVLIYSISRFFQPLVKGKHFLPKVSIIMSVYNEERFITSKINTLVRQGYPADKIEILIGSDGSTDRTDELVAGCPDPRIRFFRQEERRGKPAMLNRLIQEAKGEVLVFTDARQTLEMNAISELVSSLAAPQVGSVSGQLVFSLPDQPGKTESGVGLYWNYEKFIRTAESRTGSMLGATGALYAVKRSLCPKLPADIILDDVYIPMKIVEKGYRAVYDPDARIYDDVSAHPKGEFARKTRTLAGNFQLFYYFRNLFNPFRGLISWQFFSHKFLRLVVPFFLAALLFTNAFLMGSAFCRTVFLLQVVFYGLAAAGFVIRRPNRLTDVPGMFCVMNAAAVAGLFRFLTNKQAVQWEKSGDMT